MLLFTDREHLRYESAIGNFLCRITLHVKQITESLTLLFKHNHVNIIIIVVGMFYECINRRL